MSNNEWNGLKRSTKTYHFEILKSFSTMLSSLLSSDLPPTLKTRSGSFVIDPPLEQLGP